MADGNSETRFDILRPNTRGDDNPAAAKGRLVARKIPPTLRDFRASAKHFQVQPELEVAINMALAVGAPLLLTGEPGTGKTQVAWFLGAYFGIPVFSYQVRSTATADDLRFDFDAVGYLREAQHPSEDKRRSRSDFLQHRALWEAYECAGPCVLLIDEIDKAPRDFPNDLLQELDKHEFRHPFEDRMIGPKSDHPPIVVITSNAERRLPDAFLRRCIFHHIELTQQLVRDVVQARGHDFPRLDAAALDAAMERFFEIRGIEQLQKKPSTGELLIWLSILSARGISADQLRECTLRELPSRSALIKDHEDLRRLG